jgi:PHD/YefM family antitoxin component YafN of YafNO toxin-antitoxin module
MKSKTITFDRKILLDLMEQLEEMQLKLESLELASNQEIMESLKKSEEQIKNREFVNWDEL